MNSSMDEDDFEDSVPAQEAMTAERDGGTDTRTQAPPDSTSNVGTEADRLTVKIAQFRSSYLAGAVIVVFGLRAAGKSFLNERFDYTQGAKVERTDAAEQDGAMRRTKMDDFGTAEFKLRYGDGKADTWPVLIVDMPGELFDSVSTGTPHQHVTVALQSMNCLVLYVPATTVSGPGFSSRVHNSDEKATRPMYIDLLHRAQKEHRTPEFLPVFIGISRSDELANWEGQCALGAWPFLQAHAPALCDVVSDAFPYFGCGFVASHVGSDSTRRALEFSGQPISDEEALERWLSRFPLKSYVIESWRHFKARNKAGRIRSTADKASLLPGRTPEAHMADCKAFHAATAFDENLTMVQTALGAATEVSSVAIPDNSLPSYGVRDLVQSIRQLHHAASRHRNPRALAEMSRASLDRAGYTRGVRGLFDRLLVLACHPQDRTRWLTSMTLLVLAAVASIWIAGFVLMPQARVAADEHNRMIDVQVGALGQLPANFAINPAEAWKFNDGAVRILLSRVSREQENFALHSDILIRRPADNLHVFGSGNAFPPTRRIYDSFTRCQQADRFCQSLTQDFRPFEGVIVSQYKRSSHYARALQRYVMSDKQPGAQAEVAKELEDFESARASVLGNPAADLFVDQLLIPKFNSGLMLAHLELRTNPNVSLRRYGDALDVIVQAAVANGKFKAVDFARAGVDHGRLAMHIIGTTLATQDDPARLRAVLTERLQHAQVTFKDSRPVLSEEFRRTWERYPLLSCFTMLAVFAPPASDIAAEQRRWCSSLVDEPVTAGKPSSLALDLFERADLTSGLFWSGVQRRQLQYHKYLPALRSAAARYEGAPPPEKRDLAKLASLQETDWIRTLASGWFAGGLTVCAAVLLVSLLSMMRLVRLRWAAHLLYRPLGQD